MERLEETIREIELDAWRELGVKRAKEREEEGK
jgi:hypothetical protein